jgi:hypothetical protein
VYRYLIAGIQLVEFSVGISTIFINIMKGTIFLDVMRNNMVGIYRSFGRTCLHLQGRREITGAAISSERPINFYWITI